MRTHRRDVLTAAATGIAFGLAGCLGDGGEGGGSDGDGNAEVLGERLRVATTTSTYDTGVLETINAGFEARYGVRVETIAQGTGAALETGRRGDVDVVLVHARSLEDEFLRQGYGVNRRDVMFNDFVVVGPDGDPAAVDEREAVAEAFRAIADTGSTFVSRGDNSGTHAKERELWGEAEVDPGGEWYREVGDGMGVALVQADRSDAYTLADRGTYRSMRADLDLGVRFEGPIEGGPELLANPYGIVAVDPSAGSDVNYDLAMAYIGFLTSPEGQRRIEEHTVDGEKLFFPGTISENPNFQQYVPEGWGPDEEG